MLAILFTTNVYKSIWLAKFPEIFPQTKVNSSAPPRFCLSISVDGLVGGFIVLGTFQLHGLTYYAFKSTNSGLGELFINIL